MKSKKLFSTMIMAAILLALVVPAALAAPRTGYQDEPALAGVARPPDNRMDPLTKGQLALRAEGLEAQLAQGNQNHMVEIYEGPKGQFVELAREGEDPVWTVLGEFGNFEHNRIAEPDRSVDNTTLWVEDFNREHYLDMLYAEGEGVNSMRQYYIEQSSNRYAVFGDATDWAVAPNDACTYDDDNGAFAIWGFLTDTTRRWYDDQIADGKTTAEINEYLSQFDIWDRYDWDGDGNFDEPDGYIDHMQFVHAGEGNEAGGGELGDCAIWSHSWFAYSNLVGVAGPSPDFLIGGTQIGDSSFWLNKYVINPENGGVGVFAHEFGHDLGLPDLYDYTGENSTGFWTLMSSGSWLSQSDEDIGSEPNHMGVWEKFQLGWLNYEVAFAGAKSEHKLGPAETNTKQAQGLFVVLPDKAVTEIIGDPFEGEYFYYSGAGHYLDNFMYKAVSLPAAATLTAKVKYQIEMDWDYAYVVVSTDGGDTWTGVETNLSTNDDPNGQNYGFGITGSSGGWVDLTADLPAGDMLLGFRYWTDPNTGGFGFMVDNLEVTGYAFDGAEEDAGWTFDGFGVSNGEESGFYSNYYVVEFRQYRGYDKGLTNAYNFGFLDDPALGNWVEHFPYQDGMLVSYWDNSFSNNNVGSHCAAGRCGGLMLTVDAHPEAMIRADGGVWRNRMQSYDATFGLQPTDALTLHWLSQPSYHPSLPAVPMFDDTNSYYDPLNPMGSVITPVTGTQIRVQSVSARGSFMQVQVRPAK